MILWGKNSLFILHSIEYVFYIKQKTIATDVEKGEVYHKTIYAPIFDRFMDFTYRYKDINIELLKWFECK